jgi:putative redox protein
MQEHVVEAKAVLATWSSTSDGTACQLEFGQDHWMADIGEADGGNATPHEILDAALASCTALSLQLYVNRPA